jgi:hypothetical protein
MSGCLHAGDYDCVIFPIATTTQATDGSGNTNIFHLVLVLVPVLVLLVSLVSVLVLVICIKHYPRTLSLFRPHVCIPWKQNADADDDEDADADDDEDADADDDEDADADDGCFALLSRLITNTGCNRAPAEQG